ncbi:type II secretion system F family protein [Photobacterium nomapromontoriensis]|uniref:type II secretion system F family protein n=1 Tax=Photobacterium nomapromontoriensis TaxID=2910237 RepID=UPI003D13F147
MGYYLSLILFGLAVILWRKRDGDKKQIYFEHATARELKSIRQAINVKTFERRTLRQMVLNYVRPVFAMLGERGKWIVLLYVIAMFMLGGYFNNTVLNLQSQWFTVLLPCFACWGGWNWLVNKRRSDFEQTFTDALNIMMSAITAGESLMQAISYVGESMDNAIGREFKLMGERFKLGESPDVILQRSCRNYPYPAFIFFVVTIRANISRGGQLKNVLARLIRVLVDSRAIEKKKMAMTSEARISSKIVAAIPIIFMFIINTIKPENIDFILMDPEGRYILYYVLGSELLGLFIIWWLVRGVK